MSLSMMPNSRAWEVSANMRPPDLKKKGETTILHEEVVFRSLGGLCMGNYTDMRHSTAVNAMVIGTRADSTSVQCKIMNLARIRT